MRTVAFIANEPYESTMGSTNRQRLARAAGRDGWKVLYIETIGWRGRSKRGYPAAPAPGVTIISDLNLWPFSAKPLAGLSRFLNAAAARHRLLKDVDLIVCFDPLQSRLIRGSSAKIVYDALDAYEFQPQMSGRANQRAYRKALAATLSEADMITASSVPLAHSLANTYGLPVRTLVGAHEFDQVPSTASGCYVPRHEALTSVLVSALDEYKLNVEPILGWVNRDKSRRLTIIGATRHGSSSRIRELLEHKQVTYLGVVPPADVISKLRGHNFGWISLQENRYNEGSFPLKVWDYLAAGLPVVAVGASALRGMTNVHNIDNADVETVESYIQKILSTQVADATPLVQRGHVDNRWKRILKVFDQDLLPARLLESRT